jgi:hypothetical protein
MAIDNALASVAVKDLNAAAAWYEKLFHKPIRGEPAKRMGHGRVAQRFQSRADNRQAQTLSCAPNGLRNDKVLGCATIR